MHLGSNWNDQLTFQLRQLEPYRFATSCMFLAVLLVAVRAVGHQSELVPREEKVHHPYKSCGSRPYPPACSKY